MSSNSWVHWLVFFCGSVMGFLLCAQLFTILLEEQSDIDPTALNYSSENHSNDTRENGQKGLVTSKMDTGHKYEDTDMAAKLYQKVKILCWIMTRPENLQVRAKHVRATWAQRCNKALYMSSEENADFPAVGLNTEEGRNQLPLKTLKAFLYVHDHHLEDADWFMKANDDTYVIVDNLRWLLANHDPEQPIYFGRRFKPYVDQGYMSGGAGYVLSKEALRRVVNRIKRNGCKPCPSFEDVILGQCLQAVKVKPGDSRDPTGKETFHPLLPENHLIPSLESKSFWLHKYNHYPPIYGHNCCSDFAVSFHYANARAIYELEYLVYHLRPYGYAYRYQPTVPENLLEKRNKAKENEDVKD
ncbi:hypothetical protein STEG23_021001 [Scotinomys teguina]